MVLWFGLFLVPNSVWPGRITFHFWYIISIMIIQFLWGLTLYKYTHKIDIICPLTTLIQSLRGYPRSSEKNYGHSFIAELLERLRTNISYQGINILLLITLVLIIIEYIWFR